MFGKAVLRLAKVNLDHLGAIVKTNMVKTQQNSLAYYFLRFL